MISPFSTISSFCSGNGTAGASVTIAASLVLASDGVDLSVPIFQNPSRPRRGGMGAGVVSGGGMSRECEDERGAIAGGSLGYIVSTD